MEGQAENLAIGKVLLFVAGIVCGLASGIGLFQMIALLQYGTLVTYLVLFFISVLDGMLWGSLLILHNIMFPHSRYQITTRINPLTDQELETLWYWANGSTVQDLHIHPMRINRIVRKYVKMTLKRRKMPDAIKRKVRRSSAS
jgi:hypothetical protein